MKRYKASAHDFLFFLFLGIIWTQFVAAQPQIRFNHIKTSDGLSFPAIQCIIQDSRGFIWIGSNDGLNRYDGARFKIYRHDHNDATSISYNHITDIVEDKNGNLWVATLGGGLNFFDRELETFKTLYSNPISSNNSQENNVLDLFLETEGSTQYLWVASNYYVSRLNIDTQEFLHFNHLPRRFYQSIYKAQNGKVWLGTPNGLMIFDPKTKRIEAAEDKNIPQPLREGKINFIKEDVTGQIWLGTNSGVFAFPKVGTQITHIKNDPGNSNSLPSDIVIDFLRDQNGKIWFTTQEGLVYHDPSQNTFRLYAQNPANPAEGLIGKRPTALFQDNSGVIWIGDRLKGISYFDPGQKKFSPLQITNGDNFLKNEYVNAIHQLPKQTIWIMALGKVYVYDEKKRSLSILNELLKNGTFPPEFFVSMALDTLENNHIAWLSSPKNLFAIDFETFEILYRRPSSQIIEKHPILSLMSPKKDLVWLGTFGRGIQTYDISSDSSTTYMRIPSRPETSLAGNMVTDMIKGRDGFYWIGTSEGLSRFDPQSQTFRSYQRKIGTKNTLSDNSIWSIYQDTSGIIWLGTKFGGLNRFDPVEETFESLYA